MLINKFTPDELKMIRIYIYRSHKLKGHDFFKHGVELSHNVQLDGTQVRIQNSLLNESLLNDFLLRIRIFLLKESRCNFGNICNRTKKVLKTEPLLKNIYDDIDRIQQEFNNIMNGKTGVKILPEIVKNPEDLIDRWMNAEYFHDDIDLLEKLNSDELRKMVSQWGFQYYMLELSKRIVALTPVIEKALESK